jgi:hypothetical protein
LLLLIVAGAVLNFTDVTYLSAVPVIVTCDPFGAEAGVKPVIAGGWMTVKIPVLVPVPAPFVTEIFPVVAPDGTFAVNWVSLTKVNVVAAVPLNFTAEKPVKPLPLTVTESPTMPFAGLNAETPGVTCVTVTVNVPALVALPTVVETEILPVVAPFGTTAVTCTSLMRVTVVAVVPLNFTVGSSKNPLPSIVTSVPTSPPVGEKFEIVGGSRTVKSEALNASPPDVLTLIFPVVAVAGTVAVICVALTNAKVAPTLLNVTILSARNPVPLMVTEAPG